MLMNYLQRFRTELYIRDIIDPDETGWTVQNRIMDGARVIRAHYDSTYDINREPVPYNPDQDPEWEELITVIHPNRFCATVRVVEGRTALDVDDQMAFTMWLECLPCNQGASF